MNLLFAVTSIPLIALFAYCLTALFKPSTRVGVVLSLYIFAFAQIVLIAQIAGTIHQLSNHGFWIALQSLLTISAGLIWWVQGHPALAFSLPFTMHRSMLRASTGSYPYLWILGVAVFITYAVSFVVVLFAVPNEFDAMTYRLVRVGYWYQNSSLMPWASHNPRMIMFPYNTEFVWLWTILVRGTDQFMAFTSWISALVSLVGVYGLARITGFAAIPSLFAALLWATLPQIVLQATSHQVDLVVTACFISTIYFLYLGLQQNKFQLLLLSGIALGLAFGTKSTIFFLLPGLGITAFWIWIQKPRLLLKPFAIWGVACAIGILVFGSYVYVINIQTFESILGERNLTEGHLESSRPRLEMTAINSVRYMGDIVDFTGFPLVVQVILNVAKNRLLLTAFDGTLIMSDAYEAHLHEFYTPIEAQSWYGPLGFLLLLPGMVIGLRYSVKQTNPYLFGLIITTILFFIAHNMLQDWTSHKGRYFAPAVATSSIMLLWPLLGTKKQTRLVNFSVIIAVIVLANTILFNGLRPLIGSNAIWMRSRIEQQSIYKTDRQEFFEAVERFVPTDAWLGTVFSSNQYEYVFFGKAFNRKLLPIPYDDTILRLTQLREKPPQFFLQTPPRMQNPPTPDYLIIQNVILEQIEDTTGFEELASSEIGLTLFRWTEIEETVEHP